MADLSPAFTFFLAIIFRYEKMELKELSSHAKCVGTVLSIIGALTVTLYSGESNSGSLVPHNKWLLGGILLALHTLCVSLLLNVKTWIVKEYNEVVITVTIASFFLVMMSTIIALFAERNNPRAWILRPDMELAAILYSGLVVVTTRSMANIYACRRKGPVFLAMFTPFGMVIALVMGLLFLGESFSLASVIGGGIISIGFYGVLWGQARQEKMALERKVIYNHLSSSSPKGEPLLHNQSV